MLSNIEIQNILPHRYPFLLVDKILEFEPGKKVVGVKNVTINEPFFQGHFPGLPIMPGVLITEALAQVCVFALENDDKSKQKSGVLAGIDDMRFRRQVVPGDVLKLEAEILVAKRGLIKAKVRASVEDQTAAEGEIMIVLTEI